MLKIAEEEGSMKRSDEHHPCWPIGFTLLLTGDRYGNGEGNLLGERKSIGWGGNGLFFILFRNTSFERRCSCRLVERVTHSALVDFLSTSNEEAQVLT